MREAYKQVIKISVGKQGLSSMQQRIVRRVRGVLKFIKQKKETSYKLRKTKNQ